MSEIHWQLADEYAALGEAFAQPGWLADAKVVKENRERTVYRVRIGALDLHVKRLHPCGCLRRFLARFRGKAKREFLAVRAAV